MNNPFRLILGLLIASLLFTPGFAQKTFPVNGVADARDGLYAFTNTTIYTDYQSVISEATLLIKKGKILSVGKNINIPTDAIIIDLNGKFIYPSFIDLYSNYGIPEAKPVGKRPNLQPQMISNKKGAYSWNEALKPEFNASDVFAPNNKTNQSYRSQGIGLVVTHQTDGICRGTSTFVSLGDDPAQKAIYQDKSSFNFSFSKGKSTQNYPSSLMGAIALLRQTYYDAQWYQNQKEEVNLSLIAWNANATLPAVFDVHDYQEALRATKMGKEFGIKYIIKGKGDEYKEINAIKNSGASFIIPVNFPKAYDVSDPYAAKSVSLAQMKHWELAPTNAAHLAKANINFALTSYGLDKKSTFLDNIRKAIRSGLSEEAALKALTYTPAHLIHAYAETGSLESGKKANFFISDKDIFEKGSQIYHHWINGQPYEIKPLNAPNWEGKYSLSIGNTTYQMEADKDGKLKIIANDTTQIKIKSSFNNDWIKMNFEDTAKQTWSLSGIVHADKWEGKAQNQNGDWANWAAQKTGKLTKKKKEKKKKGEQETKVQVGSIIHPFLAYGWEERPTAKTFLIKNATVWTNEAEGIITKTDVLVKNGKIAAIGVDLKEKNAIVIDGTGKHLTPGIIDEHSHIAMSRGTNEGSQVSSAEVRVGDIINAQDINIYRQLSGGVTTSQILHGSANPIGGQSSLIKLRWGFTAEEMKFEGTDPFIKFALGENVKQSNWGDKNIIRFPQTRMGVEQVYDDYFTRAREYEKLKNSGKPYRKDLDLEAILEVLNSERFITCHSYRQSEINMLMKMAEKHGFRINTFTHVLEGYKVADKMKQHGAAGSTFSDWWAYKYEVYEAIPYNGAIMHEQGVNVAFNSDDAEMGRRLNQEAAKAVRFGGVSEEEALKFVTLNPAKMLHIDDQVGSIKVGKDADIVLWSDHPLSIYARAEITLIDGIKFFDRAEDIQRRAAIKAERTRLINKMKNAQNKGAKTQAPKGRHLYNLYHCDDEKDEMK